VTMKPLRYFFYRNYRAESRASGPLAWVVPLAMTAVLCALNLLCLAAAAMWLTGNLPAGKLDLGVAKRSFIFVLVAMCALLYLRWIASGRYLAFDKEFASESKKQLRVRTVLLIAYGLSTLAGPVLVGYLAGHR